MNGTNVMILEAGNVIKTGVLYFLIDLHLPRSDVSGECDRILAKYGLQANPIERIVENMSQ